LKGGRRENGGEVIRFCRLKSKKTRREEKEGQKNRESSWKSTVSLHSQEGEGKRVKKEGRISTS